MSRDITLFLAKVHDDNTRIKSYSKDLLDLVKKEFATRKIDLYDYERFINILTCLNLQTEETKKEIDSFIRQYNFVQPLIDVRV